MIFIAHGLPMIFNGPAHWSISVYSLEERPIIVAIIRCPVPLLNPKPLSPLLVIAGPTGSGKTALALHLAAAFHGEIINFDSLQLYRGLDIGTAKTPALQRAEIPHHLFDALTLDEGYSAGEYARRAAAVIAEIAGRQRLPVLVGGTGFYLQALLEGLPRLPAKDDSLRSRLRRREQARPGSLHRLLKRLDPDSAARIHSLDLQKLLRALEIRILTGKPRAHAPRPAPLAGYRIMILGLDPDREALRARLLYRTRSMFEDGLLDEVRGLLQAGATGREKPFEALGYKQALQHLRGEISLSQAIEATYIATCQYSKRQRTWFRRDAQIVWLEDFGDSPRACQSAAARVQNLVTAARAFSP